MRYRVGLYRLVTEETTVEVEARGPAEAELLALRRARTGAVEWEFLQAAAAIAAICGRR